MTDAEPEETIAEQEPEQDEELEQLIADLIERMDAATEGSAEHRLVERQLAGLVSSREMAQPIMEDMGLFMNGHPAPIHLGTGPGQILPLSSWQRRTCPLCVEKAVRLWEQRPAAAAKM
jgi:hypothetical protein